MSAGSPSVAVASAFASSASAWAQACSKVRGSAESEAASVSTASLPVSSSSLDTSRGAGSAHLVRSLTLAIPPFKVIDIHTGRPLGLANKHSLVLYPQTTPKLTRAGHKNRHNIRRFSSISRFSPNVVMVWATGRQRNVTKRLSLCHILLELQEVNPAYSCDIG